MSSDDPMILIGSGVRSREVDGSACSLATSLVYLPVVQAGPPSPLRQAAYAEGSTLIGPEGDPEGWKVLSPAKVTGTLFDSRQVELQCTVGIMYLLATSFAKCRCFQLAIATPVSLPPS